AVLAGQELPPDLSKGRRGLIRKSARPGGRPVPGKGLAGGKGAKPRLAPVEARVQVLEDLRHRELALGWGEVRLRLAQAFRERRHRVAVGADEIGDVSEAQGGVLVNIGAYRLGAGV